MKKNILLVGSGPSSYSSCLRLLETNNEIFLVDGRNLEGLKEVSCVYDNNQVDEDSRVKKFSENNLDMNFFPKDNNYPKPSLISGGYSNIWGGAVSLINKNENSKWGLAIEGVENSYKNLISELNIHSNSKNFAKYKSRELPITARENKLIDKLNRYADNNFLVDYSAIALENKINNSLCTICGEYSWSCKTNSSWSSTARFKQLIADEKISYIKNALVNRVMEKAKDDLVVVEFIINGKIEIKEFNKVFVGAGAIGTSKIMMNSIDNLKQVEIKSNDLVTIPYINFSTNNSKKLHTFSDIFFNFQNNNCKFFGQIYGISENLFKMSANAVPIATKLKYLVKPFLRYSGGIFLYLDENISSSLIIKEKNIQIRGRKSDNKRLRIAFFSLFFKLLKAGVLIFPFLGTKKKYGNSNHYGGQFPLNDKGNLNSTDSLGRLEIFNNVHIIDSSVLPYLEPGPITLTVMANSYRITDMVCNEA